MAYSRRAVWLCMLFVLLLVTFTTGCSMIEKYHYLAPQSEQGVPKDPLDGRTRWSGPPRLITICQDGIEIEISDVRLYSTPILAGPLFFPIFPMCLVNWIDPDPSFEPPMRLKLRINRCGNVVRVDCNGIQLTSPNLDKVITARIVETETRTLYKTLSARPGDPDIVTETVEVPVRFVTIPSEQSGDDGMKSYDLNLRFETRSDLDSFELQIGGITVGEVEITPIKVKFLRSTAWIFGATA